MRYPWCSQATPIPARQDRRPARPPACHGHHPCLPTVLHDVRSVVLVRLRVGLGDLLCGVPALRALRARLPDAHVAMVTWPEMAGVVARQAAYVDELIPFCGHPDIPERPADPEAFAPWAAAMRERRFDLALQAYGLRPAANAVTEALGARRTGGFFAPGAWPVHDLDAHLPYPEHLHEVDRHLALMAHLGAPDDAGALEFPTTEEERREAHELRAATGLADAPLALLHPGATSPSRRWPPERFAAVGDALAARGMAVAVTGVPGEEASTRAVVDAMEAPAVDLCGRTGLGAYAALLAGADLLVANDTGSAHLAVAVGCPSVTCFLSGDPVRWAARDATRHRTARVQVECNPCGELTCPIDHRCAQRLTPGHVLREVDALGRPGSLRA